MLLLSFQSFAQVKFNDVTYRGTGCPQGTVTTTISPDGSTFSVLFDEFRVQVPQYDGVNDNAETTNRGVRARRETSSLQYKACALSFTASLPAGLMADALEIHLSARGATIFDRGLQGFFASILVGYNGLSRSQGRPTFVIQKHWRSLNSGVDDNWNSTPQAIVNLNSSCARSGQNTIRFDLKNHIQAEITDGNLARSGLISVDSADGQGMLKFKLRTRRCGGNSSPIGRGVIPRI